MKNLPKTTQLMQVVAMEVVSRCLLDFLACWEAPTADILREWTDPSSTAVSEASWSLVRTLAIYGNEQSCSRINSALEHKLAIWEQLPLSFHFFEG